MNKTKKRSKSKITAIILMGGCSGRFNDPLPKQFHKLSGKEVFIHTLEKFLEVADIESIILVCPENFFIKTKNLVKNIEDYKNKNIKTIIGGKTRQKSSYLGIKACSKDTNYVIIHDGARPFVTNKIIKDNIQYVKKYGALDTCIETTDTIIEKKNSFIKTIPNRQFLMRGQTPQSFEYNLILNAHEKAIKENITNASCDCFLVKKEKKDIFITQGDESNIKITSKLDLFIAEKMFALNTEQKAKKTKNIKGMTYAIVGANGGIGSKLYMELERLGAKCICLNKNSTSDKDFVSIDLKNTKSIKKAFDFIYKKYGFIDGLINAAGVLAISPLEKLSDSEISKNIKTNLSGVIYSCKYAKIKKDGSILNIGSSSCYRGRKNYSVYSATKAALVNFTQALAEEEPNKKINILIPQRTNTSMRRKNFPDENIADLLSPTTVANKIIDILQCDMTGTIFEIKK